MQAPSDPLTAVCSRSPLYHCDRALSSYVPPLMTLSSLGSVNSGGFGSGAGGGNPTQIY